MRIQSNDLPQADKINSVILATLAVANGAKTDIEIANQVIGIEGDDRQGRYYRRAAEILGFITNKHNSAAITQKGRAVADDPSLTNPMVLVSVLNLNLYQKLLPYFELNPSGLTRQQMINYLQSIAEPTIGLTMLPRRISTIISWILTLGVIEQIGDIYKLSGGILNSIEVLDIQDVFQPILPKTGSLLEYQTVEERISNANEIITIHKNAASLERANNAHKALVNLVAQRIRTAGGIPKANQFIDLATTLGNDYIFEMKSTTSSNVTSQIRKGISQLYEYRYLENKSDANLILVIENPLTNDNRWMLDYLEVDRKIHLIWDGDNQLHGTTHSKDQLGFLNLI